MNQTLKISIARGGCRFATPLYLGGSYVLTFDGERSNEADSCVITKPRSANSNDSTGIDGLAQTVRSGTTLTLALNKQVLLDWFKDNGACDIDGSVDAHCYVFNSSGDVIADSDISIEYRPIDFAIDTTTFNNWEELRTRIVSLEAQATTANTRLNGHDTKVQELTAADAANLIAAANDATAKANATLVSAKAYADGIMNMVAKMQYIKCDAESTLESQIFHRVFVTVNDQNQHTLAIDETPVSIEGGDPETTRYVYTDTTQTISGAKTFTGATKVPTVDTVTNDTSAASAAYVVARIASDITAFLAVTHTFSAAQTFSAGITANVTGNVTGNITGNVTGNVTGNITGDVTAQNIDTGTLDATGAETHTGTEGHTGVETHSGNETHTGSESHTGTFDATHVITKNIGEYTSYQNSTGIANEKFVWNMFKLLMPYMDGSWRIVDGNVNLNPTHATNQEKWKTHSQQKNLVSFNATEVSPYGCYSPDYLYKLHLPNVQTVDEYAFYYAEELTNVNLPSALYINQYAFYRCSVLDTLNIQEVVTIGNYAFANCPKLTSLTLNFCRQIGDYGFNGSNLISSINIGALLDSYPDYSSMSTSIGQYAFYDNDNLATINIKNIKTIGNYAFYSCSNMESLDLTNCKTIGDYAFMDSGRTKGNNGTRIQLSIPNCTSVGQCAFGYYLNGSSTERNPLYNGVLNAPKLITTGNFAFARLNNITGVNAPLATKFNTNTFYDCISLVGADTMTFDGSTVTCQKFNSLSEIGDYCFNGCVSLRHIVIPNITKIGYRAFYECSNNAAPDNVHVHITTKTCYQVLSMGNGSASGDSNISNWSMGSNWRVHCSDGTIAYINGTWQQI